MEGFAICIENYGVFRKHEICYYRYPRNNDENYVQIEGTCCYDSVRTDRFVEYFRELETSSFSVNSEGLLERR